MRCIGIWLCLAMAVVSPALGQQSASYKVEEGTFSAGGNPRDGSILASPNFRITLSVLGEGAVQMGLASASHRIDGEFVAAYRPPGEVDNLSFVNPSTLQWQAEASAGIYNLYRETVDMIGASYGMCEQLNLPETTAEDTAPVATGSGYFYLVTVENRLGEEGTMGDDSGEDQRPNSTPCP